MTGLVKDGMDMSGTGIVDIDHVMCDVSDLSAAVEAFSWLGFGFTPESAIGGFSNRLAQLTPVGPGVANFFELMTINDAENVSPLMRDVLAGPDGIKMIVHIADDLERATQAFADVGSPVGDVWNVEREWTSPDGNREDVRFRVLIPKRGALPYFMNAYTPNSLSQYLQPAYQRHDNGARHIRRIYAACPSSHLREAVDRLERLYSCAAHELSPTVFALQPRDVVLEVADPDDLRGRFPMLPTPADDNPALVGLQFAVADLGRTEALLRARGVAADVRDETIVVAPTDASGILIEFAG